jgi:hypothetical protein
MSYRDHTRVEGWRRSYQGQRMLARYGHRVNAEADFKKEFFMSHREMRLYWHEQLGELWGPLSMYSRYLKYFVNGPYHSSVSACSSAPGPTGVGDVNECVCKDENGEPLNQCNECPR